ncbi:hypothetical protein YB2330_005239 [Saitoella coloradoensis]
MADHLLEADVWYNVSMVGPAILLSPPSVSSASSVSHRTSTSCRSILESWRPVDICADGISMAVHLLADGVQYYVFMVWLDLGCKATRLDNISAGTSLHGVRYYVKLDGCRKRHS